MRRWNWQRAGITPGLLVDCGRGVSRVLVTLDITPEVVEEAAAGGCELIVSHHPVIFSPLKKLTPRDVPFQLMQKGDLCHLYAHQSGCCRGRRERSAGRHL